MINLNGILNPFSSINIAAFYLRYYAFIDAIIYLILFLGVAQIAFLKIYKDSKREGKAIAVAIALCLTISMVVLEMNTGFYLGQLQPIALIVFLLIISTLLFNMFQGLFEKKAVSGAITYLIIYGLLTVPFGALNEWINTNAPFLAAILTLGAVASLIYLIIELFSLFGDGKKTTTGPQGPPGEPGKDGRDGKDAPAVVKTPSDSPKSPSQPPNQNPSVQIQEPHRSANKKYTPSQPIQLIFRTNNVPIPYKYLIQVKPLNTSDAPVNIYGSASGGPNVNITNLKTAEPGFKFPAG
ncbi:MAG TPA: hypothetical protein VEC16_06125, partial [Alphaproteobacteria bacterium]|nr:hypothetical protein [Alphaproteobacteria bacterium]